VLRLETRESTLHRLSRRTLAGVDTDPASRGDLPGERLVRPLLRHLSQGRQHRRADVHGKGRTPAVNGLTAALLTHNPNGVNPRRYADTINDLLTCDQDHDYNDEQQAFDGGAMDKFPQSVGTGSGSSPAMTS